MVGHDVEGFEVRAHWREPGREMRSAVAKLRFVRSAGEWRLYWRRRICSGMRMSRALRVGGWRNSSGSWGGMSLGVSLVEV